MAHTHSDVHEVDVIDRDGGTGLAAGVLLAVAAILVMGVIGLAVLFTRPWDDNSPNNNPTTAPGITDNGGGNNGTNNGGGTNTGSGGAGGGSDAQPSQ